MLAQWSFRIAIGVLALAASRPVPAQSRQDFDRMRQQMVEDEIVAAGVKHERVLDSMRTTPRHEFVALKLRKYAYYDMALPIGSQQTISPPFVVAYMTEQLDPQASDRVLEIGTGSGFQAAVLSPLVRDVYTIEIVDALGRKARRTLERLGYRNVHVRIGDGYKGWPEKAPFDKIMVTCSPEEVPTPLVEQLREGGKMIVPVGQRYSQNLYVFTKRDGQLVSEALRATLFVPMTGQAESQRRVQPDPLNPTLTNGSFEEVTPASSTPASSTPAGWHYLRQVELVRDDPLAPDGEVYAKFTNEDPGRGCRALQGFAIDGRRVSHLDVFFWVKGDKIRFGQNRRQWPFAVVTFYDDRRVQLGAEAIGPFTGTFDWRKETALLPVPLAAREAILRIGLLGAVGEISFDKLQIGPADAKPSRPR